MVDLLWRETGGDKFMFYTRPYKQHRCFRPTFGDLFSRHVMEKDLNYWMRNTLLVIVSQRNYSLSRIHRSITSLYNCSSLAVELHCRSEFINLST